MSRRRWTIGLGPPVALVAVLLLLSRLQADAEAGGKPSVLPVGACAVSPAAGWRGGAGDAAPGHGTWWTLSAKLDANGALEGRRLALGRGGAGSLQLELPFDALAGGPVGGIVALSTDDGRRSQIRVVSEAMACSFVVHETSDVARGAIVDPRDGSVIVHLIDRATRSDLGTWRFPGDGRGQPSLVAAPLEPNARRGPTWVTDQRLDRTGRTLAVQSCTDEGCLTRVFDLDRGAVAIARVEGDQGQIIAVTGDRIVTWARCHGLPCSVLSWGIDSGAAETILQQAESAAVTANGQFLAAVGDSTRGSYVRVNLQTGKAVAMRGVNGTERFIAGGVLGAAGLQLRDSEVGLVADGAIPRPFDPATAEVLP